MPSRLLLALAASGVVAVASPFVGEIRATVERTFPGQYLAIVLGAVIAPALLAIGVAVVRIRDRRRLRYGALASAIGLAVLYATVMQTSRTEQFHFTEYGVLALLFYRVWQPRGNVTSIVLPVCAAVVAGIADEWVQWFVPSRVGEARDVVLNSVGVVCGLLVAIALSPPAAAAIPAGARSRRMVAVGIGCAVAAGALFLQTVHLGYEVHDPVAGTFRSRFAPAALGEIAAERAERWQHAPPRATVALLSREDHYLSEALFHVEWRNQAASRGDTWSAWQENLILERFYAPALEYGSPGFRWPPEQREAIAVASAADTRPYVSGAYPFPIYAWSPWWFWTATAAIIALVWLLACAGLPRSSQVAQV